MAIVNKIKINDKNSGTIKLKNIGLDSDSVSFQDKDSLEEKYNEIYNLIPTKPDGTKGFGTVAIKDDTENVFEAGDDEIVLGCDNRLWEVLVMNERPDLSLTYTPNSLIVVVP